MTARKGPGRPPTIWHAELGQAFVVAVSRGIAEHFPIKTVEAIRAVKRNPEFRWLKNYRLRYLEKKYQEVSDLSGGIGLACKEFRKLIRRKLIKGTES